MHQTTDSIVDLRITKKDIKFQVPINIPGFNWAGIYLDHVQSFGVRGGGDILCEGHYLRGTIIERDTIERGNM